MEPTFETLLELASAEGSGSDPDIRALAGACLMSFAVAYGDSGKMLMTVSAMLMSPPGRGCPESLVMPSILVNLQRSVISVMLGKTDHPDFMSRGVRQDSLFDTFPVSFPRQSDGDVSAAFPRVHSQAGDGSYLYLQTDRGLFKVGTSYAGTVKGWVYKHNPNFHSEPGWLGHAGGCLYFRKNEVVSGAAAATPLTLLVVDTNTLKVTGHVTSRDSPPSGALFNDGAHIGVVTVNNR